MTLGTRLLLGGNETMLLAFVAGLAGSTGDINVKYFPYQIFPLSP
jgi:hypothetical protein